MNAPVVRVFDTALDAVADVVNGYADVCAVTVASVIAELEAGNLRMLAISSLPRGRPSTCSRLSSATTSPGASGPDARAAAMRSSISASNSAAIADRACRSWAWVAAWLRRVQSISGACRVSGQRRNAHCACTAKGRATASMTSTAPAWRAPSIRAPQMPRQAGSNAAMRAGVK